MLGLLIHVLPLLPLNLEKLFNVLIMSVRRQLGNSSKTFVESLGVRVVTCFEVKPRLSQWQRKRQIQPSHKTFRLCINRADNSRMLDAELWPEDISISRWFFKNTAEKVKDSDDQASRSETDADNAAAAAAADVDAERLNIDPDETIISGDLDDLADNSAKSTP